MTAIPYSNRISIRDFLARRGIQPKYERNGYGMYLSPLREERVYGSWIAREWQKHKIG